MQPRNLDRRTFLASATAGAVAVATAGACAAPGGEQTDQVAAPTQAVGPSETIGAPRTIDFVPNTISPEAQDVMRQLNVIDWETRRALAPDDLAGWQLLRDAQLAQQTGPSEQTAAREGVSLTDMTLGGVPVLEIGPKETADPRRVIVYTHGGAYTMSSARSRLAAMPALANATGMRIMSVDYTTAPAADWQTIQSQALAVIQALVEQGYAPGDIALIGDSAGGGLAACTVLNMRDQGLGSPGAVVLWSPWADLSDDGDTAVTLRDADPILSYDYLLKNSALAFAQGLDLKDPRVSPVYADFDKGFAPTLIQEGTRTIFLSTSVRLYRKLDDAGHKPVIDMYEGMPHVFQDLSIPEAATAIGKSAEFIRSQLG
jgi:epsilon-lactone hydrolase